MTVVINGTTGIDTVQDGIITSSKLASAQTPSFNGVKFPATQVASADANTLDDYEEGTWTPTHSDGTATSASATCWYRKIGDLVIYAFDITATKASATIGGLPFTAKSSGYGNFPWYNGYETTSQSVLCGHVNSGTTSFNFYNQSTGVAIQNGERVIGAGIYLAALKKDIQMTLNEIKIIDKIEVVENGTIQVREATRILKNETVIATSYHRWSFAPDSDISSMPDNVKAIAQVVWTPEVVTAYEQAQQASLERMNNAS